MADEKRLKLIAEFIDKTDKGFKGLQKNIGKTEKTNKRLSEGFKQTAKNTAILGAAVGGMAIKVGVDAVKAFQAQERAHARLAQLTKQTTGATAEQVKVLTDQAVALQKVGVVGDEVTIVGQSQLATFGLTTDKIAVLTPALLDMAVATKGVNATQEDMINIGNAVGRALEGGAGALTRYGISLTDTQKELFNTADKMERADLLAQILADNFGGLNEATRATSEGGMVALKNVVGDLYEDIGAKLVPILDGLVKTIMNNQENIVKFADAIGNTLKFALDVGIGAINLYMGTIEKLQNIWASILETIWAVQKAFKNMSFGDLTSRASKSIGKFLGFANGGVVPQYFAGGGMPRGNDNVPIMANAGELILNQAQQKNVASKLSGMTINITGNNFNGVSKDTANELWSLLQHKIERNLKFSV